MRTRRSYRAIAVTAPAILAFLVGMAIPRADYEIPSRVSRDRGVAASDQPASTGALAGDEDAEAQRTRAERDAPVRGAPTDEVTDMGRYAALLRLYALWSREESAEGLRKAILDVLAAHGDPRTTQELLLSATNHEGFSPRTNVVIQHAGVLLAAKWKHEVSLLQEGMDNFRRASTPRAAQALMIALLHSRAPFGPIEPADLAREMAAVYRSSNDERLRIQILANIGHVGEPGPVLDIAHEAMLVPVTNGDDSYVRLGVGALVALCDQHAPSIEGAIALAADALRHHRLPESTVSTILMFIVRHRPDTLVDLVREGAVSDAQAESASALPRSGGAATGAGADRR